MVYGSRLRQIGWAIVLVICLAGFVALTFRVNTVKSEVRLAERQILALEREKLLLETEFQTRANQQQLADWNRVEFGYRAPRAEQYLENERQLAGLGLPRRADAPNPIRVARAPAPAGGTGMLPAMVSPITGDPMTVEDVDSVADATPSQADEEDGPEMSAPASLVERLSGNAGFGAEIVAEGVE